MRWCFLDRIDELVPGERASGRKGVASSEDYFADHFPDFPVMPGVLQVEALAQLSGKLIEVTVFEQRGHWVWPILSMVKKAKFRRFVRPGDPLVLTSDLHMLRDESAVCKVKAKSTAKWSLRPKSSSFSIRKISITKNLKSCLRGWNVRT